MLEQKRGKIKDIKDKNIHYDEEFAKIGKEDEQKEDN